MEVDVKGSDERWRGPMFKGRFDSYRVVKVSGGVYLCEFDIGEGNHRVTKENDPKKYYTGFIAGM